MPAKKKITRKTVAKKTSKTAPVLRVKKTNDRAIFYFVAAMILGFGIFLFIPALSHRATVKTEDQAADIVAFDGQEGKTALELLKKTHQVETTTTSFGDYVTSIDGKAANSSQFWAFYVNGSMATEGAGTYTTKDADRIIFKLSNLE